MPAYTCMIRPFADRPDVLLPWLFYSVPLDRVGMPWDTPFVDTIWDDRETQWVRDGIGVVPGTMRLYRGALPDPALAGLVGTQEQWQQGLDYDTWLAGGYTNPNGCALVAQPLAGFRGAEGLVVGTANGRLSAIAGALADDRNRRLLLASTQAVSQDEAVRQLAAGADAVGQDEAVRQLAAGADAVGQDEAVRQLAAGADAVGDDLAALPALIQASGQAVGQAIATPTPTGGTQTFTASGTFLVPTGVTSLTGEVSGPGGSGLAGSGSGACSGGSGGGYAKSVITVTAGQTITVFFSSTTVWFSTTLVAPTTASQGARATAGTNSSASAGGIGVGVVGTVLNSGGQGGIGPLIGSGSGGGGGGSGTATGSGGGGGGFGPTTGGAGGAGIVGSGGNGGNNPNGNGQNATGVGNGGGGGGSTTGTGGAGSAGQVVLTW